LKKLLLVSCGRELCRGGCVSDIQTAAHQPPTSGLVCSYSCRQFKSAEFLSESSAISSHQCLNEPVRWL
jgi:hypothetical protein